MQSYLHWSRRVLAAGQTQRKPAEINRRFAATSSLRSSMSSHSETAGLTKDHRRSNLSTVYVYVYLFNECPCWVADTNDLWLLRVQESIKVTERSSNKNCTILRFRTGGTWRSHTAIPLSFLSNVDGGPRQNLQLGLPTFIKNSRGIRRQGAPY